MDGVAMSSSHILRPQWAIDRAKPPVSIIFSIAKEMR